MSGRLVLLSTSPRVASGLLSWPAWAALRGGQVMAADDAHPLLPYLEAADIDVALVTPAPGVVLARHLVGLADTASPVVFLMDPDGDDAFARELTALLIGSGSGAGLPEIEVLPGSYDLPGARLLDLVATMHRLRSPGGCPWDAEQTHESLATYLIEETYETLEAIETADRDHLREELGDLLLQVVFHSRIAEEHHDQPWSVDDVAGDIVDKLVRRHPHVFAAGTATTAADVEASWESLKAVEKGRTSAVDGVPMGLPALVLAAKLLQRADRAGLAVDVADAPGADARSVGAQLLVLVAEARARGLDAETELRAAVRRFAAAVRIAESNGTTALRSLSDESPRT